MTKVLVCWEDRFHEKLDLCLRRALRRSARPGPELFFDDARGNGGFEPYVRRDWPKLVQKGLLKSGGPIDYLICVADADRASTCCSIELPPAAPSSTSAWVQRANEAWTDALRRAAGLESARIFGRFLRWNQESLLIAAYDIEGALKRLGCRDLEAVKTYLRSCAPSPADAPNELFTEQYRKAGKCFEEMLKAGRGSPLRKGSQPRDDALEEASRLAIDRLCARVPDLADLADQVRGFEPRAP
jgi:hypothetical protein